MSTVPIQVKYKGVIYVLHSGADISVSPGKGSGPEGELLVERQYPTEARGLYRDHNGDFFAKIKLDWKASKEFDELTFDLPTAAAAYEWLRSLVKEPGGNLNVNMSKKDYKQLEEQAKGTVLQSKKPPERIDPSRVIDVSGHYVRVSSLPADILRVTGGTYTYDSLIRNDLAKLDHIEGRFCGHPFHVLGMNYDVPEHVVQLFADSLSDGIQEYLQGYSKADIPIKISVTDNCGPVAAHGGIYVFGTQHEELNNLRVDLENEVLLPVWREIWNSFQKGLIPTEEKKRALGSFKVKVLAAIRSENE